MSIPVLVLIPMEEEDQRVFQAALPDGTFTFLGDEEPSREQLAQAQIIIGNPPVSRMGEADSLRWLQLGSAGANGYVDAGVLSEAVQLTNATGAYGLAISEYMLGGLLVLLKKFHLYQRNQQEHRWEDEGRVNSIFGSTTLVVGMGDIGGEFAKRMHLLGSRVIGIRRSAGDPPAYVERIAAMEELDDLLPQADFIAMSLPGTPATYQIMDRARLAKVKPGAILLNVGRGTAVDTDALCDALEAGPLGGAVLDVTDPEPLPADHPLWRRENALITPHVSGGYHLEATYRHILEIARGNLARYHRGEPLENQVDRVTGYRRTQR